MNSDPSQIKSQYEKQKDGKWKDLTNPLSQNPTLHSQLNNFITIIYQKFRQQKNLSQDFKPTIEFKGFSGWQDFPQPTKMGHCDSQLNTTWKTLNGKKVEGSETYFGSLSIVLSQKLLLSKLGMDKLISNYQETSQGITWSELPVDFDSLIGTISHEIAHTYQFLVNEGKIKSQCESTGERDSQGRLKYPQLASEHTALTQQIQTLTIKLPEYQKFKNWWEGKEGIENILPEMENKKPTELVETQGTTQNETKKSQQNQGLTSDKWPAWVLPVGIIGGVILLLGVVYWIFKKITTHGKAKD